MQTTVREHWNIYNQCGRHIFSGASNVKCMDTRASSHNFDCSEFI